MKNKKILLLFPDGVGIRNYLYSDVFKGMEKELVLLHAFDAKTEQAVKDSTAIQNALSIPKYTESLKEKFLRELICLSRLKYNAKFNKYFHTKNEIILNYLPKFRNHA